MRGVGRADVRRGVHPAQSPGRGTRGRPGPAGRAERGTEHDLLISQARTAPGIRLAAWIPVCPVRAARQARRSTLSACALLEPADVARLVVSCARQVAAGLLRTPPGSPASSAPSRPRSGRTCSAAATSAATPPRQSSGSASASAGSTTSCSPRPAPPSPSTSPAKWPALRVCRSCERNLRTKKDLLNHWAEQKTVVSGRRLRPLYG